MPKRTKLLYALQRVDAQLLRRQRRYREVQARLSEHEALERTRAARDAAAQELTHWRAKLRDREL